MASEAMDAADEAARLTGQQLTVTQELDTLIRLYGSVAAHFEEQPAERLGNDDAAYARLIAAGERAMARVYQPSELPLKNWDFDGWQGHLTARQNHAFHLRNKMPQLHVARDEAQTGHAPSDPQSALRVDAQGVSTGSAAPPAQRFGQVVRAIPVVLGIIASLVSLAQAPWVEWFGRLSAVGPLPARWAELLTSIVVGIITTLIASLIRTVIDSVMRSRAGRRSV